MYVRYILTFQQWQVVHETSVVDVCVLQELTLLGFIRILVYYTLRL